MARTTFRLDADLLAEAKALAAKQHRTLNSLMEDALRRALAEASEISTAEPFTLHIHHGPAYGLRADISLDDSASLLEPMEDATALDERR
jgi:hypothetical protein